MAVYKSTFASLHVNGPISTNAKQPLINFPGRRLRVAATQLQKGVLDNVVGPTGIALKKTACVAHQAGLQSFGRIQHDVAKRTFTGLCHELPDAMGCGIRPYDGRRPHVFHQLSHIRTNSGE
jgi:hypothetical protein